MNREQPITFETTVEPTTYPVTVEQIKKAARLLTHEFDDEIADDLRAAVKAVEFDTDRALITQTIVRHSAEFPTGDELQIRIAPVSAVVVTYLDTDDASQTLSASNYTLDSKSTPPRIVLKDGQNWPSVSDSIPNPVTVTCTAGYGTASAVPVAAKLAIKEWVKAKRDGCERPDQTFVYRNMISQLRWTEYHSV